MSSIWSLFRLVLDTAFTLLALAVALHLVSTHDFGSIEFALGIVVALLIGLGADISRLLARGTNYD